MLARATGMGAPASRAHKDNQVARGVNDVRDPADISNKTVMSVEHSLLCCVALVRLSVQLLVRGKTQRARMLGTVVCVALPLVLLLPISVKLANSIFVEIQRRCLH